MSGAREAKCRQSLDERDPGEAERCDLPIAFAPCKVAEGIGELTSGILDDRVRAIRVFVRAYGITGRNGVCTSFRNHAHSATPNDSTQRA
jgi:hypothetical protein